MKPSGYLIAKTRLMEEIEDAIILNITPKVVQLSVELLETNFLRALDALHLACAIEWNADLSVSSDKRQITAAKKAGLRIRFI